MIYTKLTNMAMRIAYDAHKNQMDKSGVPYVFHPFHLAEQMETEHEIIVALLHDVVEDSDYTLEDLQKAGFPEDVLEAVALLTRDEKTSYEDYIGKIKRNKLAKTVKMADLRHNSDVTRLETADEHTIRRMKKYGAAIRELQNGD